MKLYSTPISLSGHWSPFHLIPKSTLTAFNFRIKKIGKSAEQFFIKAQIARMTSVLRSMSDDQLRQIDLERKDIRKHAEFLITNTQTEG